VLWLTVELELSLESELVLKLTVELELLKLLEELGGVGGELCDEESLLVLLLTVLELLSLDKLLLGELKLLSLEESELVL